VLPDYGCDIEIWDIEIPELEDDAILVEVEVATMCGGDVHIAAGEFAEIGTSRVPLILGHEIVGRIVALGKKRKTDSLNRPLVEGDLIVWAYPWCERCYWCTIAKQPSLCENARPYGWGSAAEFPYLTGGYAEYCYVSPGCKTIKVPPSLDTAVAASATCAFRTVVHGYEALGSLLPTDSVVIQGSGPVGLYALAYAITSGVSKTICIGAPADRLAVAERWGADHCISIENMDAATRREMVLELTDGRGADVAVECAGVPTAFEEGLDLIRKGGRYLVVGQAAQQRANINPTYFNLRQLTVLGTHSADVSHFYRALEFIDRYGDRFAFRDVLGKTYGLNEVNAALDALRTSRELKPIINPDVLAASPRLDSSVA
jgi:D-arabinose 1-dehydrogenase-like Zn-dependent alcohol dehydrogenase